MGSGVHEKLPIVEFAFPGPLRERLLDAIEVGEKTATSSLFLKYQVASEPLPEVGDRAIAVDSAGAPRLVVETTDVQVVAFADAPLDHALAEGEGYRAVDDWRDGHSRFWASREVRDELGAEFDLSGETRVVLERFKMVRLEDPCSELRHQSDSGSIG